MVNFDIEREVMIKDMADKAFKTLNSVLNAREYYIFMSKLTTEKTYKTIGNELNISSTRVQQLFREAVRKIRNSLGWDDLWDSLNDIDDFKL